MKRKIHNILVLLAVVLLAWQQAQAQDITAAAGTLTVSHENNNANENSQKVVDNNYNSKFLLFDFGLKKPIWIQWQANTAAVAGIYTLTSGGDAPDRDPKNWTIQGSNNGTTWTVLDTRTNEVFDQRGLTRTFFFQNATAYTHYRLNITENNGGGLFQLAEWRILAAVAPQAPTDLVALSPSGSEVVLSWKDVSNSEAGFDVESSIDSTAFTLVETVPINATTFTHTGLKVSTKYYYRVTAKNNFGKSAYTNTADATTLSFPEALVDLTNNGGDLTVQQDNTSNANENSPKFIDNNANTKFLVSSGNIWIQYISKDKAILTKYTLTSANDAADRDPKDWKLEGSNNGTNWTTLDTRANENFANRFQKNTYIIANTLPFNYYKITITTKGGSAFQAAEWELWGRKLELPAGPQNLTVKALSETEINITWKDNSLNETGFEIERSRDGTTYEVLTKLGANISEYTDKNLEAGGGYYYRVSATSLIGNSVYSNVAATRTKGGDLSKPKPVAPAILSPNDDNVNDRWVIKNLNLYPSNEVKIFDRVGRMVYFKQNYANDWDGTFEGAPLAENVYYYVIKFWPGVPDLKGAVMIVRDK
jgi:gliding motility-associated-like protein